MTMHYKKIFHKQHYLSIPLKWTKMEDESKFKTSYQQENLLVYLNDSPKLPLFSFLRDKKILFYFDYPEWPPHWGNIEEVLNVKIR